MSKIDEGSVFGIPHDMTEQQRVEEELRRLNATLEQRVAERTALIQLLQDIAVAANEATTVEKVLQFALERICEHTGWPVGHVYLPAEDEREELIPTTLWRLDSPEQFEIFRRTTEETCFAPGIGLPGRVWVRGEPVWVPDVTQDLNFPRGPVAQAVGLQAGFGFPVWAGQEVVAVLEFFTPEAVEPDGALLEAAAHIGTQLGRVIERQRLEADLERRVRERTAQIEAMNRELAEQILEREQIEAALRESEEQYRLFAERMASLQAITAAFSEALTPARVAQVVVEQGLAALGAQAGSVVLLDETGLQLEVLRFIGYPPHVMETWRRFLITVAAPLAQAVRSKQPVFIGSPETLAAHFPNMVEQRVVRHQAWAAVPLIVHGRLLGGLGLSFEQPQPFPADDRAFILALAHHCAQALERARLYEAEQQTRTELEQRIQARTAELQRINAELEKEIIERHQSEVRFATIFHTSPIPISVSTWTEGRFRNVNNSFLEWLGYRREEVIGRTSFELGFHVNPELRPKFLQRLHEQGAIQNLESNYYTKSGEIREAIVSAEMIELEGETCILTVFYDITRRKQMAAELAEVQHRLVESLERERVRLAQELHDGPVQELYGVTFALSPLQEELTSETGQAQLTTAQTSLQRAIQMLRATFTEMRPPTLAPFGLEKAIQSHAEQFQAAHPELKLELELMADGQLLPERVRLALFRIYQETLNNVVRHAGARQIWVRFSLEAAQAILETRDDGCGFEVPQRWLELARQGHLGLVGISERAEAIGGRLQIVSDPGAGTLIRVTVPRSS